MHFTKLNPNGVIQIIPLILLLGAIFAGVYLVQKEGFQIFKSRASAAKNIEIQDGNCVKSSGGTKSLSCEQFSFKVISPLEGGN